MGAIAESSECAGDVQASPRRDLQAFGAYFCLIFRRLGDDDRSSSI